ncbi:MAG: hypothetical protein ACLP9K_04335, partial [Nitrososphaerales archaeon]
MPFKLLNPPTKEAHETEAYEKLRPGETLTDWSGPRLEEFGVAPEEKKEFVPVSYTNPLYRLKEEMLKRGYKEVRRSDLIREIAPNKPPVIWHGTAYLKSNWNDTDFRMAWVTPVGGLDKEEKPVTGKWSGYFSYRKAPGEQRRFSTGWKDTLDEAVTALLESVDRREKMTGPELEEERLKQLEEKQKQEFTAKWPAEKAHKHDIDLIYRPLLEAEGFKFKDETPETIRWTRTKDGVEQYAIITISAMPELNGGKPMYGALWQAQKPSHWGEIERSGLYAKYEDAFDDLLAMVQGKKMKTTEEQRQTGVPPTRELPPAVREAIKRVLGEYVSRNATQHEAAGGMYHFTEEDVDDFLQRFWFEVGETNVKIGDWPGQQKEPMGVWKERWRPLVKAEFATWLRDY